MNFKRLDRIKRRLDRPSLNNLEGKKNLIGAEIGVQYGINAKDILERFDIKTLYLIDPYVIYVIRNRVRGGEVVEAEAKEYLRSFEDKIVWIKNYSWNVVFEIPELDFVYIDGNHEYPAVKADVELYYPKIKSGGLFAGHDYTTHKRHRGVVRAVDEFFSDKSEELLISYKADWWCIKK